MKSAYPNDRVKVGACVAIFCIELLLLRFLNFVDVIFYTGIHSHTIPQASFVGGSPRTEFVGQHRRSARTVRKDQQAVGDHFLNNGQLQNRTTTHQRDADQQAVETTPRASIVGTVLRIQIKPLRQPLGQVVETTTPSSP